VLSEKAGAAMDVEIKKRFEASFETASKGSPLLSRDSKLI